MKTHTNNYKTEIKKFGRQLDSKITYTLDGVAIELGKEQLNSVTPHYEGGILKSVMKQLDIDSNVEIPEGTIINYKFGVLVNNAYEYVDYGNYVVYKVEKQEDTYSYKITCYDKMLYSMVDYEALSITYPITIKNYLSAICTKLGLTLANDDFINNDKTIQSELYLDSEGNSLDYTFRDVLDEIAGATGSTICINKDDKLEVRYITNAGEIDTTLEGTNLSIANCEDEKVKGLELNGDTTQDGTPTPTSPQPINVVSGIQEINVYTKNIIPTNISEWESGQYDSTTGNKSSQSARIRIKYLIPVKPSTEYYVNCFSNDDRLIIRAYSNIGTFLASYGAKENGTTFTTGNNVYYISVSLYSNTSQTRSFEIYTTMFENGDIKPFICLNSETNKTYEEYKGKTYEIDLGKNILDTSTITSGTVNGVKYSNSNGTITLDETATANSFIATASSGFLLEKGTYTLSANNETTVSGTNNYIRLIEKETSTAIAGTSANFTIANNYATFTLTERTQVRFQIRTNSGTTYNKFVIKPQLEKWQTTTTYTQYKTPIELCKIGDYKDRIFKNIGKNLLDLSKFEIITANSGITYTNDTTTGKVVLNGTATKDTVLRYSLPTLYSGEVVSLSANNPVANSNVAIRLYNVDGSLTTANTYLNTINKIDNNRTLTKTYTSFQIRISSGTSLTDFVLYPQVERGQATSYEPYGTKGTWYIEKQIGKVFLDGTQTWIRAGASDGYRFTCEVIKNEVLIPSATSIIGKIISDRFVSVSANDTSSSINGIAIASSGNIVIYYDSYKNNSATEFKNE